MKALKHVDGDIYFDGVVSDADAIKALLLDRLSIIKGEYLPNVMLGVPLGATKDEIDLSVTEIIQRTTGVTGIVEFSSHMEGKTYKCKFTASTIYGRIVYG